MCNPSYYVEDKQVEPLFYYRTMNSKEPTPDVESPESISKDDIETKIVSSGRRSKIYIKLNKKFSKAFAEFCDAAKPDDMNDTEFASMIFMIGMDAVQHQILSADDTPTPTDNDSQPEAEVI